MSQHTGLRPTVGWQEEPGQVLEEVPPDSGSRQDFQGVCQHFSARELFSGGVSEALKETLRAVQVPSCWLSPKFCLPGRVLFSAPHPLVTYVVNWGVRGGGI